MLKRKLLVIGFAVFLFAAAAFAAACTGDAGPSGAAGAPGASGTMGGMGAMGAPGTPGTTGPGGGDGSAGPAGEGGTAVVLVSSAAQYGLSVSPVAVTTAGLTTDQIEMVGHGSYIVNALTDCASCHGNQPATFLGGGTAFGPVLSRNLTPDPTTGMKLTIDQFVAVLRTGADFHGLTDGGAPQHTLIVMPWLTFRWMTTYDLQSIWWYLRSIPPVKYAVLADPPLGTPPPAATGPTAYTAGDQAGLDGGVPLPPESAPDPGNVLRGLALNPLFEVDPSGLDVTTQALFGRGSYLVNAISDCSGCHTNADNAQTGKILTPVYLTGGMVFATPVPKVMGTVEAASANLIGKTHGFFNNPAVTFETFLTTITQGVHAESTPATPLAFPMPWQQFSHIELADLQAIYVYMSTVATKYGTTLQGAADKVIPKPALYCDPTDGTVAHCPPGSTCSSTTGPGQCTPTAACTGASDCAVCQQCVASVCTTLPASADAGPSVAACVTSGY